MNQTWLIKKKKAVTTTHTQTHTINLFANDSFNSTSLYKFWNEFDWTWKNLAFNTSQCNLSQIFSQIR